MIKKSSFDNLKDLNSEQFESLYQITSKLSNAPYTESLIEEVLDIVITTVNAERGVFAKYFNEEDKFTIISARNLKHENLKDISEFSSNLLKQVAERREPLIYHDVMSDPNLSQYESVQIQNIKSFIGVPVFLNNNVWGVFLVDSQKDRRNFSVESIQFLSFFSNLVSLSLNNIVKFEELRDENIRLLNQLETTEKIPDMIGESKAIRDLAKIIHRVALSDATVLILGESGTGKDLTAKAIHKLSKRSKGPYLAQFCGAIPDSLLESELFGYKKGAFTGANSDKKGLLEVADKGTFFLDEIADISVALQAKLLRVLENKEIMRIGDTSVKKIDVRIIAATNKNLRQLSKEGKFREDLFYRLNVFPVTVPPLRERKDDILLLAKHFIKKFSGSDITITLSALKKLENYYWPGNIRQFTNVIQRSLILTDGNKIDAEHLIIEETQDSAEFKGTLKEFERVLLIKRLNEFDGNRTQVAKSLGVSVRWVQIKIKEYDIS